jgi:hypothetical protein
MITSFVNQIAFAEDTMEIVYVSNFGDEENDGHSESTAKKELAKALLGAMLSTSHLGKSVKIIIIGTLDVKQDTLSSLMRQGGRNFLYQVIQSTPKEGTEIIITGKPNASETEKARISAEGLFANNGKGLSVFLVRGGGKVRFEHIEISGGDYDLGAGLWVTGGTEVTLGEGAMVTGNHGRLGAGVFIDDKATFILAGGEVKDNISLDNGINGSGGGGIFVAESATFIMHSGIISGNTTDRAGGGVYVNGGTFTMNNGNIRNNTVEDSGGGVFLASGVFTMNGGFITENRARNNAGGIYVKSRATFTWRRTGYIGKNMINKMPEFSEHPDIFIEQGAIYGRN